jgi:hypothetical protein
MCRQLLVLKKMARPTRLRSNRFVFNTEAEIEEKRTNATPMNTRKCNEKAAKLLREYLEEKGDRNDFEHFSANELNSVLKSFYFDVRTVDGDHYKASSLENLRHSLNRYMKSPPHNRTDIDVIKGAEFTEANEAYKAARKEVKAVGKGVIDHYPCIADSDLSKLYSSFDISTAKGLMNKVQFDIRI